MGGQIARVWKFRKLCEREKRCSMDSQISRPKSGKKKGLATALPAAKNVLTPSYVS